MPQHIAADCGKLELYKHFVKRTGAINPKEQIAESTAMHYAAYYGKLEVCKFIMANSDDKNPENMYGVTPLHLSAERGYLDIWKFIIKNLREFIFFKVFICLNKRFCLF